MAAEKLCCQNVRENINFNNTELTSALTVKYSYVNPTPLTLTHKTVFLCLCEDSHLHNALKSLPNLTSTITKWLTLTPTLTLTLTLTKT